MPQIDHLLVQTKPCPGCGKKSVLEVAADAFRAWRSGMLVQNAFPYMGAETREQLITGFHPVCWDKMFKGLD